MTSIEGRCHGIVIDPHDMGLKLMFKSELVDVEDEGHTRGTLGSVGGLVVLGEQLGVGGRDFLGIQREVDETGVDVRDELGRGDGVLDDSELGHDRLLR